MIREKIPVDLPSMIRPYLLVVIVELLPETSVQTYCKNIKNIINYVSHICKRQQLKNINSERGREGEREREREREREGGGKHGSKACISFFILFYFFFTVHCIKFLSVAISKQL